jgi:hypothetical protein
MSPTELLVAREHHWYKAYLTWLKDDEKSRIEVHETMKCYWNRLSSCYKEVAQQDMDPWTMKDMCNVRRSLLASLVICGIL